MYRILKPSQFRAYYNKKNNAKFLAEKRKHKVKIPSPRDLTINPRFHFPPIPLSLSQNLIPFSFLNIHTPMILERQRMYKCLFGRREGNNINAKMTVLSGTRNSPPPTGEGGAQGIDS